MICTSRNYTLPWVVGLLFCSIRVKTSYVESTGVESGNRIEKYSNPKYHDRVLGSLVGGALGDALGRPTKNIDSLKKIKKQYPPSGIEGIKSLKLIDCATDENGDLVVPYTDDIGMTLPLLKVLIDARRDNLDVWATMSNLAQSFVDDKKKPHGWSGKHRAPKKACCDRVEQLKTKIKLGKANNSGYFEWWAVGKGGAAEGEKKEGGGCGSLMRVHPCGLVFAHDLGKAEKFAVAQSTLTHSHSFALAACAAQAVGVVLALRGEEPDEVVENMIEVAKVYDCNTAEKMYNAFMLAKERKKEFVSVDDAIGWFSDFYETNKGFTVDGAIAAVVCVFTLYPDDLNAAIRLSVNTPGDSDSIASMTGALVGARTGFQD